MNQPHTSQCACRHYYCHTPIFILKDVPAEGYKIDGGESDSEGWKRFIHHQSGSMKNKLMQQFAEDLNRCQSNSLFIGQQ